MTEHLEDDDELGDSPVEGVEQAIQEGIEDGRVLKACLPQQRPKQQRRPLHCRRWQLQQILPVGISSFICQLRLPDC